MNTARSRPFDKYAAYAQAVQSPDNDARFLRLLYRNLNKAEPTTLREDFCGTFALCCEWLKLDGEKRAIGLDLDPEPLAYGAQTYLTELKEEQQRRVTTIQANVLKRGNAKADIVCAFNFSYFAFHERKTLVDYFTQCRASLRKNGIFVVDTFGGPQHGEPSLDKKRLPGLTYYFEQEEFDPINNRTRFSLHFKPKGSRTRKRAFTYEWRMWSIPEIRDVMLDAGFKDVEVYWEGTARDGRGSGRFTRKERGEPCQVWVAYVVGRT
jgi:SAM-dependent methyltransferase